MSGELEHGGDRPCPACGCRPPGHFTSCPQTPENRLAAAKADAARLSKLLFEARELIDMLGDTTEARSGRPDTWSRRVRDEIDAYRAERGWSPHGFGGEQEGAARAVRMRGQ